MLRWILAGLVLIGMIVALLWQLTAKPTQFTPQVPAIDAGLYMPSDAQILQASKTVKSQPKQAIGPATGTEVAKFDPQSEEFSHQIDVSIPDRLRAQLARCDREGIDPDAKITLTYKLHIEEGVVSTSNVIINKSDLNNETTENCMLAAVQEARWVQPDLPDFQEEHDLFIRIRSLNKYLELDEQKAAKQRDQR